VQTSRIRGRYIEQGLDGGGGAVEHALVLAEAIGVAVRELADLGAAGLSVRPQQKTGFTGDRREGGGISRQQTEPPGGQPKLAQQRRSQESRHVGGARDPEAGPELLGHTGPADQLAALEEQRLQAGSGEIGGSRQSVVPAPDHDGIQHRAECIPGGPAPLRVEWRSGEIRWRQSHPSTWLHWRS
jgi:hypothetical protein